MAFTSVGYSFNCIGNFTRPVSCRVWWVLFVSEVSQCTPSILPRTLQRYLQVTVGKPVNGYFLNVFTYLIVF